ncbi:Uncharacterised protein [Mycobacteroides abscessus subsp. massiliense]|nr:Uncharacterised protein [Mycobacteroides abscessus subsp. massiliense]
MFTIWENLVLLGQERATGIHQIDTGQPVLQRDFLCAQVLLDRHRVVGAAFDRRVIGGDHALTTRDAADARDHAGPGGVVVVHTVGRQGRQLQKRAARVEQRVDPVAWQQLAPVYVSLPGLFIATERRMCEPLPQLGDQPGVLRPVLLTNQSHTQLRSLSFS